MALSETEVQVTWSSSNSLSVSASSGSNSDTATLSATAVSRSIECKADNGGTPASGDYVDFFLLRNLGDPDGASTSEFASNQHGDFLMRLDTNTEDPAIGVVDISITGTEVQVRAVNNAGSNSITVSATILEKRSA